MPTPNTEVNKHLETLGLKPDDLNEDAIRVAYKKLALRWHPDRHNADPEEAKEKFIEVNEAYKALVEECKKRNKRKKSHKDEDGSSSRRPFWAGSTPSTSSTTTSSSTPSAASSSGATSGASSSRSSCAAEKPTTELPEKTTAKPHDPQPSKKADTHSEKSSGSSRPSEKPSSKHRSSDSSKRDASATKTRRSGDRDTPSHTSSSKHERSHPKSSSSPSSAAHKSPRPFKPSNLHSDSDSDTASECESIREHKHRHHSHSKGKKVALGEDDYEFIDLGTPLKPIRPSKSTTSSSSSPKDWIFPLHITLEDLYFGATHRYRITRTLNPSHPDVRSPRSPTKQTVQLDVHVAPGWRNGTRVRVVGVGNQRPDGSFQDIVFVVTEAPHARFIRHGDDLVLPVRVPWADGPSRPYSSGDSDEASDDDEGDGGGGGGRYRFGFRRGLGRVGRPRPCAREEEDEVYVLGMDGEEYTLPIPRTLVEAADGTRVFGAGMPVRKDGKVVGRGDLVIRWEFVFPESSDKLQRTPWQTLKDAMHLRFQV